MKENVNSFMGKIASDPLLAKKLEQLRQNYVGQLISLSKEVRIQLAKEDFYDETAPLTDSELAEAAGGGIIKCPYIQSSNNANMPHIFLFLTRTNWNEYKTKK